MANLKITISADSKEAEAELKKLTNTIKQSFEGTGGANQSLAKSGSLIDIFKGNLAAILTANTLGKIKDGLQFIVKEGMEAEKVSKQLSMALSLSGLGGEKTKKKFEELANEIQKTTGYSNTLILKNAALMQNMAGMNEHGLKEAIKGAVTLAATFDKDLSDAFDIMSKAAIGNTMGIKKLGIEFKETGSVAGNLEEILKKIDIFQPNAANRINTVAGSIDNLTNALSELAEKLFSIQDSKLAMLINTAADLVTLVSTGDVPDRGPSSTDDKYLNDLRSMVEQDYADKEDIYSQSKLYLRGSSNNKIKTRKEKTDDQIAAEEKAAKDKEKEMMKYLDSIEEWEKRRQKEEKETIEQVRKNKEQRQKSLGLVKGSYSEGAGNIGAYFDPNKTLDDFGGDVVAFEKYKQGLGVGGGIGVAGMALQGTGGASSMLSQLGATGLNAMVPGLGTAAGPLIQALMAGPEQTKKMVEEFVDAIPTLIEKFAEALPVLVTTLITRLADKADEIIIALVKGVPKVIMGIVDGIPQIISGLVSAMPQVVASLAMAMPGVAAEFLKGLLGFGGKGGSLGGVAGGVPGGSIVGGAVEAPLGALGSVGKVLGGAVGAPLGALRSVGKVFGGAFNSNFTEAQTGNYAANFGVGTPEFNRQLEETLAKDPMLSGIANLNLNLSEEQKAQLAKVTLEIDGREFAQVIADLGSRNERLSLSI